MLHASDAPDKIVVVKNGIIENFWSWKEKLQKEGHKFVTELTPSRGRTRGSKNSQGGVRWRKRPRFLEELRGIYALVSSRE